jgi:hypothetical protein
VAHADTAPADAAQALAQVAAQAQSGTATLAQINRASLLVTAGKPTEALDVYRTVMNDSSADPVMRDMATLRYALLGMDNGVSSGELWGLVQPLAMSGQPLAYSAMEVQALLSLQDGNIEQAQKTLHSMIDAADCPPGLRSRATSLLAQIAPATSPAGATDATDGNSPS